MNVAKQSGFTDCALYAMAIVTCLALNIDPLKVVHDQEQLRPHLIQLLEKETITSFPVLKRQRPATSVSNVELCPIFCHCRLPDDGDRKVCCDTCDELLYLYTQS